MVAAESDWGQTARIGVIIVDAEEVDDGTHAPLIAEETSDGNLA